MRKTPLAPKERRADRRGKRTSRILAAKIVGGTGSERVLRGPRVARLAEGSSRTIR